MPSNPDAPRAPLPLPIESHAPGGLDRAFALLSRAGLPVLLAAVLLQVGVLLALVYQGMRPATAAGARTVLLKVIPVDPRDLTRGDYVTLAYDFSRSISPAPPGAPIYAPVELDPDGRHARTGPLQAEPPPPGALFLRGESLGGAGARFGIEKFFVPEGEGKPYEEAVLRQQLWAEVVIAPDGEPRLLRLVIE